MLNETLIAETGRLLAALPEDKAAEVVDFARFLLWQTEASAAQSVVADDLALARASARHVETSPVFAFLHDPVEDVYTVDDLKVRYQ